MMGSCKYIQYILACSIKCKKNVLVDYACIITVSFFSTTELKTPENELYYDYVYIDKANNTTPEMLNILKPIA